MVYFVDYDAKRIYRRPTTNHDLNCTTEAYHKHTLWWCRPSCGPWSALVGGGGGCTPEESGGSFLSQTYIIY